MLRVSVGGVADEEERVRRSTSLATAALMRLPKQAGKQKSQSAAVIPTGRSNPFPKKNRNAISPKSQPETPSRYSVTHSARSASIGSTLAARRAGIALAISAASGQRHDRRRERARVGGVQPEQERLRCRLRYQAPRRR